MLLIIQVDMKIITSFYIYLMAVSAWRLQRDRDKLEYLALKAHCKKHALIWTVLSSSTAITSIVTPNVS